MICQNKSNIQSILFHVYYTFMDMHLLCRLSKEWSDKVAGNESDVENISIKNRPMVVAEEYQRLFTDEWLEVKTMLDARTDLIEEQKIAFLCDIFMVRVR